VLDLVNLARIDEDVAGTVHHDGVLLPAVPELEADLQKLVRARIALQQQLLAVACGG
jgi:hypothetical protein